VQRSTSLFAVAVPTAFLITLAAHTAQAQARPDSLRGDSSSIPVAPLARTASRVWGVFVGVIDSSEIASSTAPTFSELLQARLPGLRVLRSGGLSSDGSLVLLRGPLSFFNSSAPVLIVDGVRVDASQADTVPLVGAVAPSRLDDIAPEDIQRIEVLSGPAAALYGDGAAAGVIVVTTKSGGGGPLRFSGRVQFLSDLARDEFPANYRRVGTSPSTGQPTDCSLPSVGAGSCTPTGLDVFNPLEQESPFRTGRSGLGQVALGGTTLGTRLYVSATGIHREGVLPHDQDGRLGARAKLTRDLPGHVVFQGTGGYLRDNARMALDGGYNVASDVISNGLIGFAESTRNRGYNQPVLTDSLFPAHLLSHLTGGVSARWDPLSWLEASVLVGRDRVTRTWRLDDFGPTSGLVPNIRGSNANSITTRAARVGASYHLGALGAATSFAMDYAKRRLSLTDSINEPPTLGTASSSFLSSWTSYSLVQSIELPGAIVVNGAVESLTRDFFAPNARRNEPFPSVNAVWTPRRSALVAHDVRVHAAYAELPGRSPELTTLLGFPISILGSTSTAVKMERTKSVEIGVDASFVDFPRVSVNLFQSRSLHLLDFAGTGSNGAPLLDAAGEIQNRGVEALTQLLLLRFFDWQWTATVSVAALQNRVTHWSGSPFQTQFGVTQQGSAVGAVRVTPYTFADANNDGIIEMNEVQLGAYVARPSLPTLESGISTEMRFSYGLSVTALADYRHGNTVMNSVGAYRCQHGNCQAIQDPSTPLDQQAAAIATVLANGQPVTGMASDGSFVKLREVALRWRLPDDWSHYFGGNATVTLAGRNLSTSTKYNGIDPEITSARPEVLPRDEFGRTPIPRTYLLRLDIGAP